MTLNISPEKLAHLACENVREPRRSIGAIAEWPVIQSLFWPPLMYAQFVRRLSKKPVYSNLAKTLSSCSLRQQSCERRRYAMATINRISPAKLRFPGCILHANRSFVENLRNAIWHDMADCFLVVLIAFSLLAYKDVAFSICHISGNPCQCYLVAHAQVNAFALSVLKRRFVREPDYFSDAFPLAEVCPFSSSSSLDIKNQVIAYLKSDEHRLVP